MEEITADSGPEAPSPAHALRMLINVAAVATVVIAALATAVPV